MKLSNLLIALALLGSPALADGTTIDSCGGSFTYDNPPTRAATLNQQATEIMLALGLEGHMAGTAYMDDAIPAQWLDAYNTVPVLSEKYPAREIVMAADVDFLFAGFVSAFSQEQLGAEVDWHELGIGTYLVDSECRSIHPGTHPLTTDSIVKDIRVIGDIFDVESKAETLVADIETRLKAQAENNSGAGRSVFLYDSGTDAPFSAGCCGSLALLAQSVGLENISSDVNGRWVTLNWERVVKANPDIILLIEADWSSATEKRAHLEADPVLSNLKAVQNGQFVTVPFSQTLLGMRFVDGVENLSAQLKALN